MSKKLLLFFAASAIALAESPFGFGLKAGVPLNDALSATPGGAIGYVQDTHRFTIGPFAEFRLPAGFSVELDALYRSYSFRQSLPQSSSVSTSAWEFPLLAKKSLIGGPNSGIVLGAGISLHVGPVRVTPEIRYNGWAFQSFSSPLGNLHSNRNQATVLVGISF